jgi:recombination protein RecR
MNPNTDVLTELIHHLKYLPGVGPRSAERLAYYLLKHRVRSQKFAQLLTQTLNEIQPCEQCNHYSQTPICRRCQDTPRSPQILCIVEQPQDLLAIEQSHAFHGRFFILMGRISPLEGIGPEELQFNKLLKTIKTFPIKEVILALSPTVEGQTTAYALQNFLQDHGLSFSQLAQGIPLGGELAHMDGLTLANAIKNRAPINATS